MADNNGEAISMDSQEVSSIGTILYFYSRFARSPVGVSVYKVAFGLFRRSAEQLFFLYTVPFASKNTTASVRSADQVGRSLRAPPSFSCGIGFLCERHQQKTGVVCLGKDFMPHQFLLVSRPE